jgi:hypothetical protein
MNQGYWIDRVRILNRRDCCGGRLAGTKVMVDNQLCGQVPGGTRNGQWYTVKCSKPMYGGKIRLVTTQRTYLSISGFEAWTGSAGSSTTTTTSTGGSSVNIRLEKNKGMVRGTAKQSTNYGNNSYPASNAWSNGPKFTHTNAGVG